MHYYYFIRLMFQRLSHACLSPSCVYASTRGETIICNDRRLINFIGINLTCSNLDLNRLMGLKTV